MLDRERPLWKMYVIQGYDGNTTAVHARIQHSIADGWALVRVVLSLCDDTPEAIRPEPVDKKRRRKRDLVAKAASPAVDVVRSPRKPSRTRSTWHCIQRFIEFGSEAPMPWRPEPKGEERPRVPVRPAPRQDDLARQGQRREEDRVDEPAPLQPIKDIGRAVGATINDVLLAVLTNALRQYSSRTMR